MNIELTDAERQEYEAAIKQAVIILTTDPTEARRRYFTPDRLLDDVKFIPEQAINGSLLAAVTTHAKILDFGVTDYKNAVRRLTKQWHDGLAKDMAIASRNAALGASLGIAPSEAQELDERRYITAFMAQNQYRQSYDRRFWRGTEKEPINVSDIINDAILTASTLGLIKPRGNVLGATNIERALLEWSNKRRAERKAEIWQTIAKLPPDRDPAQVAAEFMHICELWCVDPPFAYAAFLKFIWSVKRQMLNLPIIHHHAIVLIGPQGCGKSEGCRLLLLPLDDLSAECNLKDILDERQMDLMQYYALFPDELAYADRADITALKSFITGGTPARRPMRSNIAEKTPIHATIIATSNNSLGKVIFDQSGTRRFVELDILAKIGDEKWLLVANFDWSALWQMVDPYAADPLMSKFEAVLTQRQEEMRNRDNCELWLADFDYKRAPGFKSKSGIAVEFYGSDLFLEFHAWETTYDPGYKTSIQKWGRDMKSHIQSGKAIGWTTHKYGPKQVYVYTIPDEVRESDKVIRIPPRL